MRTERLEIGGVPAIVWGESTPRAYLYVHGKMSCKESARVLAEIAAAKGFQTVSFDLPEHGERAGRPPRCDVWNGMADLLAVADWTLTHWREVSLCACSLGAYFALQSCAALPLRRALFVSPIVDMEWLVRQMMLWTGVTPERLEREGEIPTPIDPLRWDYYQYILAHPVERWPIPAAILCGGRDELQPASSLRSFAERFGCALTIAENSRHAFMGPGDEEITRRWLTLSI